MPPGRSPSPASHLLPVTVRVPAKINLYLGVGPLRADRYHSLTTVYQAVSLYDEVTVARAGRLVIEVQGEGAEGGPVGVPPSPVEPAGLVPRNSDNLAARAARLMAKAASARGGVRINLAKGIPVAGGMAGGSADAAAALVACAQLWGVELPPNRLQAMAAQLGSDVPFLLAGRTALGTGRGEDVAPVLSRGVYHWVFALDSEGLSTPEVYAELDRQRAARSASFPSPGGRPAGPDGVLIALRAGDVVALGRALHNDLQAPALRLRPRLQQVLDAGREFGALGALVSGSGPTCAFLARDATDATRIAGGLTGRGVCRTVRRAHGPVAGARVVV
ncbi:MAG: 4-(cytidine 5'-diphospho)-2-C-methyl-D-erythritol kinase [Frankiaceae bacterium]